MPKTKQKYGYVPIHIEPFANYVTYLGDHVYSKPQYANKGEGYYRVRKVKGGWVVDEKPEVLFRPDDQNRFIPDEE